MNAAMNSVNTVTRISTMLAISRVMLKFSASLAWSAAKGRVSFLISQMISGPTMLPMPPVNRPASEDRWPNRPHWRSSALGVPEGAGGSAV